MRSSPRQTQSSLHSRQAGQGGYRLEDAFGADGPRVHAQPPQTGMSRSRSPRWSTPSLHPTSLPNASFSRLESFWMNGELVVRMDKETGPIDVSKHVAAERKSHDSHQTHAQENQSTKRVRRKITPTHRTHGPHIEGCSGKQSEAELSADECTTTWMIRHAACLQHESPLEPTETLSAHVNISRITRVNFYWCGLQRMQECHPTRMLWSHSSRFMSQVLRQKLFDLPVQCQGCS